MNFERPTNIPTLIDELGHLSASEMMRVSRLRRDAEDAERIAALYGESFTTTEEVGT